MPKRVRTHVNPLSITKEISFSGFGNAHPIFVDVGACKGEFTEELLKKFPEKNFIVFEIRVPLVQKLREKFKKFSQVAVFEGDAGRNFQSVLEPCIQQGSSIEAVFINFPDPWFKARHKKRRFINPAFLEECSKWFPKESEFIFQTDQNFLFDETQEILKNSPFSHIEFFETPPFGIRTHWEMQKMKEQSEFFRMKFRQNPFH